MFVGGCAPPLPGAVCGGVGGMSGAAGAPVDPGAVVGLGAGVAPASVPRFRASCWVKLSRVAPVLEAWRPRASEVTKKITASTVVAR
ncbi:MAG TPA: hypothetical protein VI643_05875, partial [Planctomycetota bacterium]|nr:hypothetical protein [Planctomycetota bacterium]